MKPDFYVIMNKDTDQEKLMQRLATAGFTYLARYKENGLLYALNPDFTPPVPPKRRNKPGQGRHKKKLLKADGTEYTCGDVIKLCWHAPHNDAVMDKLGISETTFYERKKAHKAAGEYYSGSTTPF